MGKVKVVHGDIENEFDPHALEELISQLDLCFVIDTTASMGPYIDEARKHVREEVAKIAAAGALDVQYAIVEYRDHPPQDPSFASRIACAFSDAKTFGWALDGLHPAGGGDGPESVWDGLITAANDLQWRPTADHLMFLVGDYPPHGVSYVGDAFPDGCPCKATAGGVIELLGSKHIRLNAISLISNAWTTQAFREVAEGCRGECVEVLSVREATIYTGSTVSGTSSMIGAASFYAVTMSTDPTMTDASYSAATGTPMATVTATRNYLRSRGIEVPDGKKTKRKKK